MSERAPVITLLSDYGLADEFVGVCHGVIARICPQARIIDVTHQVPAHDIRAGAVLLANATPYLPVGVHVAIVDPTVGAERRAVAVRLADERVLIGPDNGLLWPAAQACGGVVEAVEISHSPLRLEPVSATFHGRDIFCPVAAHVAAGHPLAAAGEPLDPERLVMLELPTGRLDDGALIATVINIDRFGNAQLGASSQQLGLGPGRAVELRVGFGAPHSARYGRTFADVGPGELVVYEDAARRLALAANGASAAELLGLRAGDEITLAPPPGTS